MPEGDTVWLAARRLDAALGGSTLRRSDFRIPSLATVDLSGALIEEVLPRGKHLLFRLRGGDNRELTLHTHFRMDGSWHLYRPGDRWRGGPMSTIRLILETAEWNAVGYRLPVIELLPRADEDRVVGHLGPDLLGPGWDTDTAVANLLRAPESAIGPALLDQRNLAGIGNLYKAESLFMQRVNPWTPVGTMTDLRGLVERARALLLANRDRPEQSTTGRLGRGQQHWVFERTGRPCRRCGNPVRCETQDERLTYWCATCQDAGPRP